MTLDAKSREKIYARVREIVERKAFRSRDERGQLAGIVRNSEGHNPAE